MSDGLFICPVCKGNGLVSNGFYNQTSGQWSSTSTTPEQCRSCYGLGYIGSNHNDESCHYKEQLEKILDLWLTMLDDGIGGLPTNEEVKWFRKLSDILPKELKDKHLRNFSKSILGEEK